MAVGLPVTSPLYLFGGEAEGVARLDEEVDVVLEDVGDAEVPHGEREEVLVEPLEVADDLFHPLPRLPFCRGVRLAVENAVLGVDHVAVKGGEPGLPEVEHLHLIAGMTCAVTGNELPRHLDGCREFLAG
jgi:hypothetical protein